MGVLKPSYMYVCLRISRYLRWSICAMSVLKHSWIFACRLQVLPPIRSRCLHVRVAAPTVEEVCDWTRPDSRLW